MLGRRIFALVFTIAGVALVAFAMLIALGAIDQTAMKNTIFIGLTEGSPLMYFILGAAASAFGLYIFIATFRRRE